MYTDIVCHCVINVLFLVSRAVEEPPGHLTKDLNQTTKKRLNNVML